MRWSRNAPRPTRPLWNLEGSVTASFSYTVEHVAEVLIGDLQERRDISARAEGDKVLFEWIVRRFAHTSAGTWGPDGDFTSAKRGTMATLTMDC